jgi:hypothetical protein
MEKQHISIVRVEDAEIGLLTRIGRLNQYSMRVAPGPLTERMRNGEVWRVRWIVDADEPQLPEAAILFEAKLVDAMW